MSSVSEAPTNFFGGSPLNRLAWLRTSDYFVNAIVESPATRWLVLKGGQPLVAIDPATEKGKLAQLTTEDVRALLGPKPYFSQGQTEGAHAEAGVSALESARFHGPDVTFLGLQEPESESQALPSSEFSAKNDAVAVVDKIKGTPYFSLDVTRLEKTAVDAALESTQAYGRDQKFVFLEARAAMSSMDVFYAAVFAEARALVDWNARNRFCAACGSRVYSLWAGWKLACSSLLPWADNAGKEPCPTAVGLHNQSHPRTDPVVIMAVVNEANTKILLGRNRKWPGKFYSALAGFIEPGESFEDAVKRELWEEAGLKVWGIKYHSTQPWPFPANLMVGFYAIADESQPTRTDLDNELEDARWYTRDDILRVLDSAGGTTLDPSKPFKSNTAGSLAGDDALKKGDVADAAPQPELPSFRLPPLTAIAGVLIDDWARQKIVITGPTAGSVTLGSNL